MKENQYPILDLQPGHFYVYCHTVTLDDDSKRYYIGYSQRQPRQRWQPGAYKRTSLEPYIKQFGWENIQHSVLAIVQDKHSAEVLEDNMIRALKINGLVINQHRSGGIKRNKKEYDAIYNTEHREERKAYHANYRAAHREEKKAYDRQYRSKPEGKIYQRVYDFNRRHPDRIIETPMEAKQKYLQTGKIPDYIKRDDLQ